MDLLLSQGLLSFLAVILMLASIVNLLLKVKQFFGRVPVDDFDSVSRAPAHELMIEAIVYLMLLAFDQGVVGEVSAIEALVCILCHAISVLHQLDSRHLAFGSIFLDIFLHCVSGLLLFLEQFLIMASDLFLCLFIKRSLVNCLDVFNK